MKAMNSLHKMLRHRMLRFLFLTVAVIVFSSCADDLYEDGDPRNLLDFSDYPTRFSSGTPEDSPSGSPRKISTDYNMKYWWTFGDKVWVKVGNGFIKSDTTDIPDPVAGASLVHDANFYFLKKLTEDKYEVRYTGNGGVNGLRADSVHITPVQWQTALGAGHVGKYGDCGVATATRKDDGNYTFNLNHKASFLLFTPRIINTGNKLQMRSIKITKLNNSSGDSALCGSYYFDADGLHTGTAMKNAGKSITLNLFKTNALGKEECPFALYNEKSIDSALYMVLQPGKHKLQIEYELKPKKMQLVRHNKSTNKYEYTYPDTITWKEKRELKSTAHTFTPNGFTKVAHKFGNHYRIPYTYYQWGAMSWFWAPIGAYSRSNDGVTYPTNSDPADAANYEKKGAPMAWSVINTDGILDPSDPVWFSRDHATIWWGSEFIWEELEKDREKVYEPKYGQMGTNEYGNTIHPGRSIAWMPSANEMTYYLKYGDIHRDNTTLWSIDSYTGENVLWWGYGEWGARVTETVRFPGYDNDETMCRGGIWIKKKAVIEAEGHPFSNEKAAWQINGQNINLREQSPGSNYMFRLYNEDAQVPAAEAAAGAVASVKYGIAGDTTKYFFLPLLGYMHNVANSPGRNTNGKDCSQNKAQYKFVGAEGYYWTRTPWPNVYFPGEESKVPSSYQMHGKRESYYLRITPYYVSLGWDIKNNRIHGFVGNERLIKTMEENNGTEVVVPWFQ